MRILRRPDGGRIRQETVDDELLSWLACEVVSVILKRCCLPDRMPVHLDGTRSGDSRSEPDESLHGVRTLRLRCLVIILLYFHTSCLCNSVL